MIKRKVNTFRGVGDFGEVMVSVEEGNIKSALYCREEKILILLYSLNEW